MTVLSATAARQNLFSLIDEVAEHHKPIIIKGKRHSAVLISEDELSGMKETIYLMSIPGMWESIDKASKTPLSECTPWREVFKK